MMISTLDDLITRSPEELTALFDQATSPNLADMDGPLLGRMLAFYKPRILFFLTKPLSDVYALFWQGKTFRSISDETGEGVNRLLGNRLHHLRFKTSRQAANGTPPKSIWVNYDVPDNLRLSRCIRDEIREVAPGLWLGIMSFHLWGKQIPISFFALEKPAIGPLQQTQKQAQAKSALRGGLLFFGGLFLMISFLLKRTCSDSYRG